MTIILRPSLTTPGLLADEDVLPQLQRWQSEGQRTTLVTLTGIEGGAPRHPGAQMAVAEDGCFAGYLSGGCLEAAVVEEARSVIASGCNRSMRYGRGSPYFDIRLPCGSGLDLYFDQGLSLAHVADLMTLKARRQPAELRTLLSTGASTVSRIIGGEPLCQSHRDGDVFTRVYPPQLRLALFGTGPALLGTAELAAAMGVDLILVTPDDATRAELSARGLRPYISEALAADSLERLDVATAAILFFHAHDAEPRLLSHLLKSGCFYVGALGNHAVHRQRLAALSAMGFSPDVLSRIRAPVGSIANAKSKASLAVSVLADVTAEAKMRNLIA